MPQHAGETEVSVKLVSSSINVEPSNLDTANPKSDIVEIFHKRFQWVEKHIQQIEKDIEAISVNYPSRILANFTGKTSTKELIARIEKVRSIIDAIKDNFQNLNEKTGISLEEIQEFIEKNRESERRLQKVEQKLFQKI